MTKLSDETSDTKNHSGIGCSWTLLAFNTLLYGITAISFGQGTYSSGDQELWYRYGSLAFFLVGSVIPAIALFGARQSRWIIGIATAWMFVTLLPFLSFLILSGGGA